MSVPPLISKVTMFLPSRSLPSPLHPDIINVRARARIAVKISFFFLILFYLFIYVGGCLCESFLVGGLIRLFCGASFQDQNHRHGGTRYSNQ